MPDYITRTELQRMVDACDPTTLAGKRDRLLLVVLRALGGRSREVAALRECDALLDSNGEVVLYVGRGIPQVIDIPDREYSDTRLSGLLTYWKVAVEALHPHHRITDPLFRSIAKNDKLRKPTALNISGGLNPASINQTVKRTAARAGLDNPEQYSARCMRGPARRKVAR